MKLHCNIQAMILLAQMNQQNRLITVNFFGCQLFTTQCLLIYGVGLLQSIVLERNIIQTVVAGFTAVGMEKFQPVCKCCQHIF